MCAYTHPTPRRKALSLVMALSSLMSSEAFTTHSVIRNKALSTGGCKEQSHPKFLLHLFKSPKSSPLEDEPWKKDGDSYWDLLQQASKDPETFEKFIEESMERKKIQSGKTVGGDESYSSSVLSASSANGSGDGTGETTTKKKKKGAYQPIEEWDSSRQNGENMSAEERLQWECQRGGNQFRQNEILRHNLNSF